MTPRFPQQAKLEDKLRTIAAAKRMETYQEDLRRAKVCLLSDLFFRGYQNLGPWNDALQSWPSYSEDALEYQENRFRRNALINAGLMVRMEPSPIVRPASGAIEDLEAAQTAQDAWDKAKEEVGYDQWLAQKSLIKVLFGTAFSYQNYEVSKRFKAVMAAQYAYEDAVLEGGAVCGACGYLGQSGDAVCPACGMPMTEQPPVSLAMPVQTGVAPQMGGSLTSAVFSPLEISIRAKVKGGLPNAPYLLRVYREDVEVLEYAFPDFDSGRTGYDLGPTISDVSGSDAMVRYQQLLASLPGNVSGAASGPYWTTTPYYAQRDVLMAWLTPVTYRRDAELLREFPDGVLAVMCGMQLVEVKPEALTDHWTSEIYLPNAHSFYGDGMFDDVPIQRSINTIGQLQERHLEYDTIPLRLYDDSMIRRTPQEISNDPALKWIAVNTSGERTLQDAVRDLNAQNLSWDVNALMAARYKADQDVSGATDPLGGQVAGANTPYSAQLLAVEQAQVRFIPSARANKDAVRDHVRQLLQLAQKNWTDPRTLTQIDQNTGRAAWKTFTGMDLARGNWNIYIGDSDFKPKSRGEQMQALEQARVFGVDLTGSPKMRLKLLEQLGMDDSGDMLSTQAHRAFRQIERMRAGGIVTPTPLVDDAVQIPVIQEWLASPQADDLLSEDEGAWLAIYTYLQTLLQMAAMQQAAMAAMGLGPAPAGEEYSGGGPQQPGGPKAQKVERAQSNQVPEGSQQPMPQVPARAEAASKP